MFYFDYCYLVLEDPFGDIEDHYRIYWVAGMPVWAVVDLIVIIVGLNNYNKSLNTWNTVAENVAVAEQMAVCCFTENIVVDQGSFVDVGMIENVNAVVTHCHKIALCIHHGVSVECVLGGPQLGLS